jgi:hypothetical protein
MSWQHYQQHLQPGGPDVLLQQLLCAIIDIDKASVAMHCTQSMCTTLVSMWYFAVCSSTTAAANPTAEESHCVPLPLLTAVHAVTQGPSCDDGVADVQQLL